MEIRDNMTNRVIEFEQKNKLRTICEYLVKVKDIGDVETPQIIYIGTPQGAKFVKVMSDGPDCHFLSFLFLIDPSEEITVTAQFYIYATEDYISEDHDDLILYIDTFKSCGGIMLNIFYNGKYDNATGALITIRR